MEMQSDIGNDFAAFIHWDMVIYASTIQRDILHTKKIQRDMIQKKKTIQRDFFRVCADLPWCISFLGPDPLEHILIQRDFFVFVFLNA